MQKRQKKELEIDINEMTAMLDSYVSFVKSESPEPIENIIINEIIYDCTKNYNQKKCSINIDDDNKIKTSGRPLQLKRAFQNIIDNCIRYSNKIEINFIKNEQNCYVEFNDNGPGIPVKNYEDVFKPFFTLDPSRNKLKGESGLGLTIARDIIRSHGGDIKLNKSKFDGLQLRVSLPI